MIVPPPWVGDTYSINSVRLLVVGESHYAGEDLPPENITCDVVNGYAITPDQNNFFRPITELLRSGTALGLSSSSSPSEVWHRVAFVNFVVAICEVAKTRPTDAAFRESLEPFRSRVEILKPTHIAFFSIASWKQIPDDEGSYVASEKCDIFEWKYSAGGRESATCGRFPHPSRGWLARDRNPSVGRLQRLLEPKHE